VLNVCPEAALGQQAADVLHARGLMTCGPSEAIEWHARSRLPLQSKRPWPPSARSRSRVQTRLRQPPSTQPTANMSRFQLLFATATVQAGHKRTLVCAARVGYAGPER
jgi:hypothetical protein